MDMVLNNHDLCYAASIVKAYIREFKDSGCGIDSDYEKELNDLYNKLMKQAVIQARKEKERN